MFQYFCFTHHIDRREIIIFKSNSLPAVIGYRFITHFILCRYVTCDTHHNKIEQHSNVCRRK